MGSLAHRRLVILGIWSACFAQPLAANAAPDGFCGDGVVDEDLGEQCDDGNTIGGDGCNRRCRTEPRCGDGNLDAFLGEECDDGNLVSGDGCEADCRLPVETPWHEIPAPALGPWGLALALALGGGVMAQSLRGRA